jgi:hypothetical protein
MYTRRLAATSRQATLQRPLLSNGSTNTAVVKQQQRNNGPRLGLTPRLTDRLTDRQSQCNFDFDSNTSTVTLRVVGGDEKETLRSETVKYRREAQGTRTRERLRWQGPAAYTKDRPILSSERAPSKTRP